MPKRSHTSHRPRTSLEVSKNVLATLDDEKWQTSDQIAYKSGYTNPKARHALQDALADGKVERRTRPIYTDFSTSYRALWRLA